MDVNPLVIKSFMRRNRRSLLLLLGVIMLVPAGLASVNLYLDLSVSPREIDLGDKVTVFAHVYDTDYPGVKISYQKIIFFFSYPNGSMSASYDTDVTNASGWAARSYTPPTGGRYTVRGNAYVNYSLYPPLPPHNGFFGVSSHDIPFNVTSPFIPLKPVPTAAVYFPFGTTTLPPVTTTPAAPTTTTPVPAVTTTTTAQQTTLVTQVSLATPAPQTSVAVPALQSDTTPPVTTLTFSDYQDRSGVYSSGVICTLTAADNAGGNGVSVTQYSFDGTSWNTYSQPFQLVTTGPMILYYRSSDNAGNTEVANVKALAISGTGTAPDGTAATLEFGTPSVATASRDPFYPLPLWLIALIIFVFIAAIGGGLYLKSRLDAEQKK